MDSNTVQQPAALVKSLPVQNLNLVAFACVVEQEQIQDGDAAFSVEYEIYDNPAWERMHTATVPDARHCQCCNRPIKYACFVEDVVGHQFFAIGRACARKIISLRRFNTTIANASVALVERLKCQANEKAFVTAYPDAVEAVTWAHSTLGSRIAKDIVEKIRRYGNPSPAQAALLVKVFKDDQATRANATGTAPSGKQEIEGVILSIKLERNDLYDTWNAKTLISLSNGTKVYGNAPSSVYQLQAFGATPVLLIQKGARVKFSATFEPSDRDPLFGYWKRPTKWVQL